MEIQFEWDEKKAQINLKKHGVSFDEAATIFGDTMSITIDDPIHSTSEPRWITIGRSAQGKLLVVAHAERGDDIRLISARKATRKERHVYEEESGQGRP